MYCATEIHVNSNQIFIVIRMNNKLNFLKPIPHTHFSIISIRATPFFGEMEVFLQLIDRIKIKAKIIVNKNLNYTLEFRIIEFFFKILGEFPKFE